MGVLFIVFTSQHGDFVIPAAQAHSHKMISFLFFGNPSLFVTSWNLHLRSINDVLKCWTQDPRMHISYCPGCNVALKPCMKKKKEKKEGY